MRGQTGIRTDSKGCMLTHFAVLLLINCSPWSLPSLIQLFHLIVFQILSSPSPKLLLHHFSQLFALSAAHIFIPTLVECSNFLSLLSFSPLQSICAASKWPVEDLSLMLLPCLKSYNDSSINRINSTTQKPAIQSLQLSPTPPSPSFWLQSHELLVRVCFASVILIC